MQTRFESQVIAYMRNGWIAGKYSSMTEMAEDAIDTFDLDATEGAPVWEWAFEITEEEGERHASQ